MSNRRVIPPMSFWIVSLLFLFWNIFGLMMFIHQWTISDQEMEELSFVQQDFYRDRPMWVLIAFGIAVSAGVLGCLSLLLKRKWAKILILVSLIGIIVQMSYSLFLENVTVIMDEGAVFLTGSIILVAILLLWYSNFANKKGWLK